MDASNPIVSSDRVKLCDLYKEMGVRRRQDLNYLAQLAQSAPRTAFAAPGSNPDPEGTFKDFSRMKQESMVPSEAGLNGQKLDSFLQKYKPVPVDPTERNGRSIHPPTKNQSKGYVTTTRNFHGTTGMDPHIARGLAANYPLDILAQFGTKFQHSFGTAEGFVKRVGELTTRKTVSEGTPQQIMKKLKTIMPIDASKLPDWNDMDAMLNNVDVTYSSSAGAPYWKTKREALLECMEVVLPEVVEHINNGTIGQLYQDKPEWFLCEMKNKLDRYETDRLDDKCRPYVNQPMHFSLLFSALVQPFCHALELWTDNPNTYNAYGMSAVNGGLMRILERARKYSYELEAGETKFIVGCYGDDGKIIACTKGHAFCVDPDFRQMDGSVDHSTCEGVAAYIYHEFSKKYGPNSFWKDVLELMVYFATQPSFIIHGTDVWGKRQKDGILSGVVGTTLFDTAKAALAYDDLVCHFKARTIQFGNKARITEYLKEYHGLEVKEGTWKVVPFNLYPNPGDLVCENKFLGVKWMMREYQGIEVMVPYLDEEDWLPLLLTPRDSPSDSKMSDFSKTRRSFDRLRGLLITGAIFNPPIANSLFTTCDAIPGNAILTAVQAGGGKGEVENHVLLDGFEYTSSSAMPSEDFVLSLYSDYEKEEMVEVFPTLVDVLDRHKRSWKERVVAFKISEKDGQPVLSDPQPPTPPAMLIPMPQVHSIGKNVIPKDAKRAVNPRPLQDVAEFQANSVEKGKIVLTSLPLPVAPISPIRSSKIGPKIEVKHESKTKVLKKGLSEFISQLCGHDKHVIVHKSLKTPARQTLNLTLQANGFQQEWTTRTIPGPVPELPDGQSLNIVRLSIKTVNKDPFSEPYLGATEVAWAEGSYKIETLKDILAAELIDLIVFAIRDFPGDELVFVESSDSGIESDDIGKPIRDQTNPFMAQELKSQRTNHMPNALPEHAELVRNENRPDWSLDVTLEARSIIKDATPEVIKQLSQEINEYWKTKHELTRDAQEKRSKPKTKTRNNNKEEWKSPSTSNLPASKAAKKKRRAARVRKSKTGPQC